jgi:hypothetical protein
VDWIYLAEGIVQCSIKIVECSNYVSKGQLLEYSAAKSLKLILHRCLIPS